MRTSPDSSAGKPPAGKPAEAAFFTLLGRELEASGKPEAVPYLEKILKLRIEKEEPSPGGSRLELILSQKLTEYSLRLNATSSETISWYMDFLAEGGTDETPVAEATKIAEAVAMPPDDAKLKMAEYDSTSGRTIFRARWYHSLKGVPIEGDFIEVLVNGAAKQAFSYIRKWRTPHLHGDPKEV